MLINFGVIQNHSIVTKYDLLLQYFAIEKAKKVNLHHYYQLHFRLSTFVWQPETLAIGMNFLSRCLILKTMDIYKDQTIVCFIFQKLIHSMFKKIMLIDL